MAISLTLSGRFEFIIWTTHPPTTGTSLHWRTDGFAGGLLLKGKKEDGGREAEHKAGFPACPISRAATAWRERPHYLCPPAPPPPCPHHSESAAATSHAGRHTDLELELRPTMTHTSPGGSTHTHTHKVLYSSTLAWTRANKGTLENRNTSLYKLWALFFLIF